MREPEVDADANRSAVQRVAITPPGRHRSPVRASDGHRRHGLRRRQQRRPGRHATVTTSGGAGSPSSRLIEIANFQFGPADVVVDAGTEVVWRNADTDIHSIISTGGLFANSDTFANGESYSVVFSRTRHVRLLLRRPPVHGGHDHRAVRTRRATDRARPCGSRSSRVRRTPGLRACCRCRGAHHRAAGRPATSAPR